MKTKLLSLSAALLLVSAAPSFAEINPKTVSFTPYVGGYIFDGTEHLKMSPTLGLRLGYDFSKRVGAELGGGFIPAKWTKGNTGMINAAIYRLDLMYNFMPESQLVPFVLAGGGGMYFDKGKDRHDKGFVEYGLGAKYFLNEATALRGDVRNIINFEYNGLSNVEYTVGLAFFFGKEKPLPKVVPPPVAKPVAPAAPSSSLSVTPQSVAQGEAATLAWSSQNASACNIQPGIGPVATQGSRTVTPSASTTYTLTCDGAQGTVSSTSAAMVAVNAPAPSAPTTELSVNPASVKQGESATLTWSSKDATSCTIQPEVGAVPPQGSRVVSPAADTSYLLTCSGPGGSANSAATLGVVVPPPVVAPKVEAPPVPVPAPVVVAPVIPPVVVPVPVPAPAPVPKKVAVSLELEFKTGKADIASSYHDEIGKVAEFMKKYPNAKGVIEGYTDNVGKADANVKLSQRRAESVRQYLIDKYKIAPSRLTAKGFGPAKPVADNSTAAGRQKNRRIQASFDTMVEE